MDSVSPSTRLSGTVTAQTSERPTMKSPRTMPAPAATLGSERPSRPAAKTITPTIAKVAGTSGVRAPDP
ncbi:hypothetical protein [Haloarcula pelagica]|uniref:hypothetical protein n=1 Tax=Halomicroarcula sp. GCM10025709 TaxID=3252669 RepID=UPI0036D26D7E